MGTTRQALGRIRRRLAGSPTAPAGSRFTLRKTIPDDQAAILDAIAPFTMTTVERQVALLDAVDHVEANRVPGALVECGVWLGGSVLSMALRLQQLAAAPRDLYLYDTFEGMTEPSKVDLSDFDDAASAAWSAAGGRPYPELFDVDGFDSASVRARLVSTGHAEDALHLVVGDVMQTIPADVPEQIAILRLDTDWYESTRHELEHLYPRLSPGGVLIVDDYGHWKGSRQAVDEYFADRERPLLLAVDYSCRVAVKP